MQFKLDFDSLTTEQTIKVLKETLQNLSVKTIAETIDETLTGEQADELVSILDDLTNVEHEDK